MKSFDSWIQLNREEIGSYIHHTIKVKNYTIEAFAEKCGMSKKTIYNIIQGKGYTMDSFLIILYMLEFDKHSIQEAFLSVTETQTVNNSEINPIS